MPDLDDQVRLTGAMIEGISEGLCLTIDEINHLRRQHGIEFDQSQHWVKRKPVTHSWFLRWAAVSGVGKLRFKSVVEYLSESQDEVCIKAWLWYCNLALVNKVHVEEGERVGD